MNESPQDVTLNESPTWARRRRAPNKGDKRNQQIYETAARLFYERGYAHTSLQALADAVGLQKGSLYHYISSKEDLLYAIAEYTHAFFMELVTNQTGTKGSPAERLERLLFLHARFAAEHFHLTAVFYNDNSALTEEHRQQIVATRDSYETLLRTVIMEGQRSGEFHDDVDPKVSSLGLLGMINWIHHWYRPGGPLTPDDIALSLSRMAVRSLQ